MTTPVRHRVASCDQHIRYRAGCPNCQARASRQQNSRSRAIAYGTWQPTLVDATPARERITHLHDVYGMSLRHIARAAACSGNAIQRIATGQARCERDVLSRVLNVQPEEAHGDQRVPAIGSARRLQGLAVTGHSPKHIAGLLDVDPEQVREWRRLKWQQIAARHHHAIARLAARLDGTRGPSEHSRQIASRRGWVPLAAWDDIDNPNEHPQGVLHHNQRKAA